MLAFPLKQAKKKVTVVTLATTYTGHENRTSRESHDAEVTNHSTLIPPQGHSLI